MSTVSATGIRVDMRSASGVRTGTFPYESDGLVTDWHAHDLDQLEYAISGTVEVKTAAGRYLLPPHQAAWIPHGLFHQTTISREVKTVSVFFEPGLVRDPGTTARIVAVTPVVRELIRYGTRWPIGRPHNDDWADEYFRVLSRLVAEGLDQQAPLFLPTSTDPLVAAAMAYTDMHLATATASDVAHAVGVSERTLRRQFQQRTGSSWRSYLLQSRLMRAMVLLAVPGTTVVAVSRALGFTTSSAFTRSFAARLGQTPSAYQRAIGANRL
jgi:AraC-like DNA-binding protein